VSTALLHQTKLNNTPLQAEAASPRHALGKAALRRPWSLAAAKACHTACGGVAFEWETLVLPAQAAQAWTRHRGAHLHHHPAPAGDLLHDALVPRCLVLRQGGAAVFRRAQQRGSREGR